MSDYDVIIIGAGGAGLAAAATATSLGKRVLLVDAADRCGGSTALSGGVYYAAGTSVQRTRGIEDSPDAMFHYYMTLNQYKLQASVVRRLCDEAPRALEWLISIGVRFLPENLYVAGVDKIPRGHRAEGMGAEIATALEGVCSGTGLDTALETRVNELLFADGKVCGIRVNGDDISAEAVVIATGGFGNNPELLARLYPDAARQGNLAWYIGSKHSRGDGLAMGQAVGAGLYGHNRGLLLVTPGFARELETYLPGWLVYVNRDGRRFVDETIEYSVLASVVRAQVGEECFAIFDEDARRTAKFSKARPAPNWTADRLEELTKAGKIVKNETVEGLAEIVGIRAAALVQALKEHNADWLAGRDSKWFKPSDMMKPVATGPFYATRITAAVVCWTGCGLMIDSEARVLDRNGRSIPGLFAAGETTGGAFGECYAAGGASIANAVVFGRIAGRNAAQLSARAR